MVGGSFSRTILEIREDDSGGFNIQNFNEMNKMSKYERKFILYFIYFVYKLQRPWGRKFKYSSGYNGFKCLKFQ